MALHAPLDVNWLQCSTINVFGGPSNNPNLTDTSLGPAQNDVSPHKRWLQTTYSLRLGHQMSLAAIGPLASTLR